MASKFLIRSSNQANELRILYYNIINVVRNSRQINSFSYGYHIYFGSLGWDRNPVCALGIGCDSDGRPLTKLFIPFYLPYTMCTLSCRAVYAASANSEYNPCFCTSPWKERIRSANDSENILSCCSFLYIAINWIHIHDGDRR